MEYDNKQLIEKFEQLPEELQMAIWDLDLDGVIGGLGWKYKLHVDQLGKLADETASVLIGIKPASDFRKNLAQALPEIEGSRIDEIVNEVNREIFLPIRESLQKVGENKSATTRELAEQPIRAPATTIFNEKMSKLFRIPREEVDLNHGGGGAGNGSALAPNTNPPPTTDPYRELTN